MNFDQSLAYGKIAESDIARWLMARGHSVLPVYEKEVGTGKGPQFFSKGAQHAAPDMLVFPSCTFVEAKHKSVFSWHRITGRWVTGIDLNHYQHYLQVQEKSGCGVWLFFLHRSAKPDQRDLDLGSPAVCPTGLFRGALTRLVKQENHRHNNHGRHGMVYWAESSLQRCADISELASPGGYFAPEPAA